MGNFNNFIIVVILDTTSIINDIVKFILCLIYLIHKTDESQNIPLIFHVFSNLEINFGIF